VKHEVLFEGILHEMSAREALHAHLAECVSLYRTHRKEARFLDQYLNSPYCKAGGEDEAEPDDPMVKRIMKWRGRRSMAACLKTFQLRRLTADTGPGGEPGEGAKGIFERDAKANRRDRMDGDCGGIVGRFERPLFCASTRMNVRSNYRE